MSGWNRIRTVRYNVTNQLINSNGRSFSDVTNQRINEEPFVYFRSDEGPKLAKIHPIPPQAELSMWVRVLEQFCAYLVELHNILRCIRDVKLRECLRKCALA